MTALDATLVVVKPGMRVPVPYLEALFAIRKSGLGYAAYETTDEPHPELSLERASGEFNPEFVGDICALGDQDTKVIWLFSGPKEFNLGNLQPFVVLGEEAKPLLVGFSAGSFPNYRATGDTAHTNDWFMWNKFLIPKLQKISKTSVDTIFAELEDPVTKQEFTNYAGSGGVIVLQSPHRVAKFYDEANQDTASFEWGFVSDHHGYKEQPARMSKSLLARAASGVKEMIGMPAAAPTDEPVKQIVDAKTDVTAIENDIEYTFFTPTDEMREMSNKAMKNIYRSICGFLPKNWHEYPTVRYVKRKKAIMPAKPPKVVTTVKDFKDIPMQELNQLATAAHVDIDKQVTSRILPIMSPKLVSAIKADYLDKASQPIPIPPDKLDELEKKYATFWEVTGSKEDDTDAWTWETYYELCTKYPVGAAVLLWNTVIKKLQLRNQLSHKPEVEYEEPREDEVDTSGTGIMKEEKHVDTEQTVEPAPQVVTKKKSVLLAPNKKKVAM